MNRNLLLVVCILGLLSCKSRHNSDDSIIATVYDYELFASDLKDIVPKGTNAKDSSMIVQGFIDSWIRKNLIIHQAEYNLLPDQMDFDQKLEDYRNSLITYAYESELIRQKLDTLVSETEIRDYYGQNRADFELKYNVVKAVYVVLPIDSKRKKLFRDILDTRHFSSDSLEYNAGRFALSYYNGYNSWIRFDDLLSQVPIKTYNQEVFLRDNRFIEFDDKPFSYLILIKDFLIAESMSPIEMETENIRNIIINKRKRELISKMHQEVYNKAVKENAFKIYTTGNEK
jgi:hypothetical protein